MEKLLDMLVEFYKPILVIGLISAAVTWIFAMLFNLIKTDSNYATRDYFVSFFWCLSLLIVTTILNAIVWCLYFYLIFPGYRDYYWFAFSVNTFVFFVVAACFYYFKISGYFRKLRM